MAKITPREYALMALASYYPDNRGNHPVPGSKWKRIGKYFSRSNWDCGFSAFINEANKQLVFGIKGTQINSFWNIVTDFGLLSGFIPPMTDDAEDFIQDTMKNFDESLLLTEEQEQDVQQLIQSINTTINSSENIHDINCYQRLFGSRLPRSLNGLILANVMLLPLLVHLGPRTTVNALPSLGLAGRDADQLINRIEAEFAKNFNSDSIEKATKEIKWSFPQYKISITGHSLGGAIAEILAARLGLPSVTFDSPGTKRLINTDKRELDYNLDQFVSFLSAPNIINCCHPHIGTCYRLYISHVQDSWTKSHVFSAILGSSCRLAYHSTNFMTATKSVTKLISSRSDVADTKGVISFIDKIIRCTALADVLTQVIFRNASWTTRQHAIKNIVACFDENGFLDSSRSDVAISFIDKIILYTALTDVLTQVIFRNASWTTRQHAIKNIVACFDENGFLDSSKVWKVIKWPYLSDRLAWSRFDRTKKYFNLFEESNRGLHNIFDENRVIEAQTRDLPNYDVIEIKNAEQAISNTIQKAFDAAVSR